jgi:DNA ligase-1
MMRRLLRRAAKAPSWNSAETCAKIAGTTRKLEKTAILSDYLKALDPKALPLATVWFTGTPFPSSQNKALQLGWAIIRDSLCTTLDVDQSAFGQVYLKHSDLGEAAFEMMDRSGARQSSGCSIEDIDALFEKLLAARGPTAKLPVLIAALKRISPLEAKFLVKILTGDLRIGLKRAWSKRP